MQGRFHVCPRTVDVGADLTIASANPVIGIDGSRATVGQPTGTERYAIELLAAMADLDPPDDIHVYFNSEIAPLGVRYPGVGKPIPSPRFWTLRSLALEMRRNPPDLLFVPSHVIPPAHPSSVVTVHDLGYLVEPGCHEPLHRKQLEWTTRWNCHAATAIIAVSDATRHDLIQRLGVPPDTIHVIHHGVSPEFRPVTPEIIARIRTDYSLPERFILAVGSLHPRKNLVRLIQAFERIAPELPDLALVLSGAAGWRADEILERARRSPFSSRIFYTGYVRNGDLPGLYSAASVTAFVSLYEGFGLPALESMACGTPVVAANRSALPEICGDAALLANPIDPESISDALHCALEDSQRRQRMIEGGITRAASFTWQSSALQTLAFLRAIRDNSF